MNRTRWMLASLILLTLAVYWPVHRYGLIDFDDPTYLYDNPHIRQGLTASGLHDAFCRVRFANYAPLVSISYYIDQDLFHLRPGPMHVENVLLHLIGGLLLWRVLFTSTGSLNRSYVVAGLFLCHPLHVESVAWISERKDVLSTALLFGAMLCYVRYSKQHTIAKKSSAYALMVLLYILSLLTKSMGTTLPAVLLLMDFWPLRRWPNRSWFWLVVEKIPLVLLTLACMTVTAFAQTAKGATATIVELSAMDRINNATVCYCLYIAKLLVPINLSPFYQHPGSRPLASAITAAGLLTMATIFIIQLRQKRPYLIVGWLWFLGTLIPVIGLVQVGSQAMADRYSYFPSIGLFIAAVWGLGDLLTSTSARVIVSTCAIGLFSMVTAKQVTYWRDSQTLFTHAAAVTDDNPVAHNILARVAYDRHDLKTAIQESNLALKYGENARAYDCLGNCWMVNGIPEDRIKAIGYYRRAVALDTHSASFLVNLAAALRLNNNLDEARENIQRALAIDPESSTARKEAEAIQAGN